MITKHYKILKNKEFTQGPYSLVTLRREDIFKIMKWRNDQIDILRQKKPLTRSDQEEYFNNVVEPTFSEEQPKIMLFSLLLNGECVGYGGLVYIDWQAMRAEVSFLVDSKRAKDPKIYREDHLNFLALLNKAAFDDLIFNRLFAETYDCRPLHLADLKESGYKFEGRLREHVKIAGQYVDSLINAILKEEYESKK